MPYDLPRATLGRTGLEVTRYGVGGAYCETVDGYKAALDCGVNYVDTARSYHDGKDEKVEKEDEGGGEGAGLDHEKENDDREESEV